MDTWTFEEAAEKLDTLCDAAEEGRPQRVTIGGRDAVVILSIDEYDRLAGGRENKMNPIA